MRLRPGEVRERAGRGAGPDSVRRVRPERVADGWTRASGVAQRGA